MSRKKRVDETLFFPVLGLTEQGLNLPFELLYRQICTKTGLLDSGARPDPPAFEKGPELVNHRHTTK
ncbi:hypothetical protein GGQ18_002929 [Salinibacter ruber]|jgi:hypothetical protein|nr:hypothetical protein [Salinibacter ruber]